MSNRIFYTYTDEAPALATHSFLPIVRTFLKRADIEVVTKDISLAERVLAAFNDHLPKNKRVEDALSYLGKATQSPHTNIIKLPNISASVPQLKAAIAELQAAGYDLPDYPDHPTTDEEKALKQKYDAVKGSAVNPVLREGNSDRRAPKAVKAYAKKHPHSMGEWSKDSKTRVATMKAGDFFHNEQSITVNEECSVDIVFETNEQTTLLKKDLKLINGEIIDASFISKKALMAFISDQIKVAKSEGLLFSLHMKATMMKVSDPVMFGHAVSAFIAPVLEKYADEFKALNVNLNNGYGDLVNKLDQLSPERRADVEADLEACFADRPDLAMVDSDKGITNLHVPSDVIIDASMPAMIRNSGKMWDKEGKTQDTLAVIPDSTYADIYTATIEHCKAHGAFDPTTMGTVPNVGLMAQKAEEYGSHDKTFILPESGTVKVVKDGEVLMSHAVEEGDIWRACRVKDAAVKSWVSLAVERARLSGMPAIFWLDENRAHDAQLIHKVNAYLAQENTTGLDIRIMSPMDACVETLRRVRRGEDTISVTGNVLRDYLTDLFPILELGTSAKMLSIVPLMNGGGLFETGAGGSAPKHVTQLVKENHLRWDSLGEFLALAASLNHMHERLGNLRAKVMADALDEATTTLLMNEKSPKRKVGELDNRGSHVYLALYWAEALAKQEEDFGLQEYFKDVYAKLENNIDNILSELEKDQGHAIDLGGYYFPNKQKLSSVMRPSHTFNSILQELE
jgi:isocitrate dehydrogenase